MTTSGVLETGIGKNHPIQNTPTQYKGNNFSGSFYRPEGPEDTTLVFESRFESGNLAAAAKVSDSSDE